MTPEFSHILHAHEIGAAPRTQSLAATEKERTALAKRFDLLALDRLEANVSARAVSGGVQVTGRFRAGGAQACGLTGAPVAFDLDEPLELRFTAVAHVAADEVELTDADLDTLPMDGDDIDLGEAVAQSLGLALDPYPRADGAALPPEVVPEDQVVPLKRPNPFGVLKGS
ncbi:YceD family protein [Glacieibacterium frigidum]|uniref:DUF177 domain-containing protein n=1 Tax=Glacieibacterium frigidum TaxID=2593303 RepID=A0A552U958_9SPHN|nr:DUF177 domain-containing protein [Glacieibacterium frigidum]TRW14751.1 DUF177 domain-containing protein [Glacieibacterium frigidum]